VTNLVLPLPPLGKGKQSRPGETGSESPPRLELRGQEGTQEAMNPQESRTPPPQDLITFTLPIETVSEANVRVHWAVRADRAKKQRSKALLLCPRWDAGPLLRVELVRLAPRRLDTDNLVSAVKAVRDGIAARLGVDDGSPLVEWRYGQMKGLPSVRVTIQRLLPLPGFPTTVTEVPDGRP